MWFRFHSHKKIYILINRNNDCNFTFYILQGFQTFFYISCAMYLVYLALLILKAYSELRSMPFFGKILFCNLISQFCLAFSIEFAFHLFTPDMRLKFLTLLMLFVVSITIVLAMNRFGFGVLEDNFVASLNTTYKSSAQFMCFYGLLNFYLFTMAYVYSPSGRVHGKKIKNIEFVLLLLLVFEK